MTMTIMTDKNCFKYKMGKGGIGKGENDEDDSDEEEKKQLMINSALVFEWCLVSVDVVYPYE